jgi:monoterpene epsilon-lactone hydrolase
MSNSVTRIVLENALKVSRLILANGFLPHSFGRSILDQSAKRMPEPEHMESIPLSTDIIQGQWIYDNRTQPTSVLLYFHGGGYHLGSFHTHKRLVYKLSLASNTKALFLDYKMAPEFPFPAALIDGTNAYQWLLKEGYSPKQIVFAGDSAGGGLAVGTALKIQEMKLPLPQAIVCISPWFDLEANGDSMDTNAGIDPWLTKEKVREWGLSYAGKNYLTHPHASPIHADIQGLPPFLIHVGSKEVLLDDTRRFLDKAKASNVKCEIKIWEKMIHVFQCFDTVYPDANKSIGELGRFLKDQIELASRLK